MAPSALRCAPVVEIPRCRIDPAAEGRGCLSTWPASLSAAAAWALTESPGSGSGPGTALPHRTCGGVAGVLADLVCSSFRCRWPGAKREPERRADIEIRPYGKTGWSAARHRHQRAEPMSCPACCRALSKCQESGSGKQRWSIRFPPRPTTQSGYAGTRLFAPQGKAQGRRGHRHQPHRFARPPRTRKGGPDGPPFRHSIFSFDWRSVKKTCRGQVFSVAPAELISAGGNLAGAVNGGGFPAGPPRPRRGPPPHARGWAF